MLKPGLYVLAGSVIIPLELFEYDAAYHGAMVRAFGGCVIAQDDATAGQLVTQHGLLCITLDGKISRPGSMQVTRCYHFATLAMTHLMHVCQVPLTAGCNLYLQGQCSWLKVAAMP